MHSIMTSAKTSGSGDQWKDENDNDCLPACEYLIKYCIYQRWLYKVRYMQSIRPRTEINVLSYE